MPQRHTYHRAKSEFTLDAWLARSGAYPTSSRVASGNGRTSAQISEAHLQHLLQLIEQNEPLAHGIGLVLLYGPFQLEMAPDEQKGVGSWMRSCFREHGVPSLIRFDYRRRAQIFRRDQFQPWVEKSIRRVQGK